MAEISHPEAMPEGSSQANTPKDTRPVYEVGFHVVPTVSEAELGQLVEKIRSAIMQGEAQVLTEQMPQKMTLAYTIERSNAGKREKYTESYFGFITFVTEREFISALETMLRSSSHILRYLLIETSREDAAPRRAIYTSDRLEGETIKKPVSAQEDVTVPVSEEELDKSIEAITQ